MRHVHERDSDLALHGAQLELQRLRSCASSAERLVEQQHPRRQHQRPGQRDALLLTTRQLRGAPFREIAHADQVQRVADALLRFLTRCLLVLQPERDVVPDGHERKSA